MTFVEGIVFVKENADRGIIEEGFVEIWKIPQ